MIAESIVGEFKAWNLMGRSFDVVERWARGGSISWDSYECYRFIWELGAYKFSVSYPVKYNLGDVLIFRRVVGLLGLVGPGESLALDCERDLVIVNDDGGRVAFFAGFTSAMEGSADNGQG